MLCRESYADFSAIFRTFYRYLPPLYLPLRCERLFGHSGEVAGMAELSGQGVRDDGSIPVKAISIFPHFLFFKNVRARIALSGIAELSGPRAQESRGHLREG
jgi:hypothetical protein